MTHNAPALLWDLDGTIVDSKDCHYHAWTLILGEMGLTLDEELFLASFGRNNQSSLPQYLGYEPDQALFDKIVQEKESLFLELVLEESGLIPGVESWLAFAQENEIRQAVASSSDQRIISLLLEKFGLLGYFDAIQPGAHLPAKPAPDIFLLAAEKLGKTPEQCVVVEDSLAGVQGGKNAGMKCVAVTSTFPREALTLADQVVDDYTGPLRPILQALALL